MKQFIFQLKNVVGEDHTAGLEILGEVTIEAKDLDKAQTKVWDLETSLGLEYGQEVIAVLKK